MERLDVLIVGAGISGIGGAVHLSRKCPGKSFAILEGRKALGGTWDLFRYPGIRSDSDMYTLGFVFKPWTNAKAIADGPSILNYLKETVSENNLGEYIRYEHKVRSLSWSSDDACWTVECEVGPEKRRETIQANFVFMGTGYYSYTDPYRPEFAGREDFKGEIVHPQFWPEKLDFKGKRVVVIGSGATAVTLIPAMADEGAGHMTMLQRSPTYIVSRPAQDRLANWLNRNLPIKLAYALTRWKNIGLGWFIYNRSQTAPKAVKERILSMARTELGPDFDIATHLTPRYNPWDQRMCLIPDSDLFRVLREGKAEIVTAQIDRFTENGVKLTDGVELPADIIVTATGLKMEVMSGVGLSVDGRAVKLSDTLSYKGFMYSDVPNLLSSFGYSNASWTLKSDLIANYLTRLIKYMDERGLAIATPHDPTAVPDVGTLMNLTSGYVQRSLDLLPKQGSREPWKAHHNYFIDRRNLKHGSLAEGMVFAKALGKQDVKPVEKVPEFAEAAE